MMVFSMIYHLFKGVRMKELTKKDNKRLDELMRMRTLLKKKLDGINDEILGICTDEDWEVKGDEDGTA